jgi:alpha-glucosidase
MKRYLTLCLLLIFESILVAQPPKGKTLGDFISMQTKGNRISITTTHGQASIQIFSPTIIKISVAEKAIENRLSYAVIAKPVETTFTIDQNNQQLTITTDSLSLKIDKNPLRFTFKTASGKIINQDDPIGTYWLEGKVFSFKKLFADEKFVGLGEKTGHLNRRGEAYTHWNTDNPHYQDWDDPLYSTIPFYTGIHDRLPYGIFVDNTSRTTFNFGAGNNRFTYFSAEDSQLDYYFIFHHRVKDILADYTLLTGRMKMPPLWGTGFQQCRWSYTPDKEVMEVAQQFRNKQIPLDVIYLDIDYMNHYKVFTWNPSTFSQSGKMIQQLRKMGIHTAVIVDPGIKVEKGYPVYDEAVQKKLFIRYPDGTNYTGQVWPGWCNFPDFTNPLTRKWWGKQFKVLVDSGVSGFWNDMNEIATWGKEVPPIIQMNWEGKGQSYLRGKNVYGMQMARSTFEGTKKLMRGKRPLVLTRSGYAGLQRYTAIWTGDNQATDDHMLLGIRLLNSFGLSGVAFAGYDAGGFGGDATPNLYARWMSLAAFSPFFRAHSAINTRRSEPWSYGETTESIVKRYINLRYHLLPYLYAAFREASQTGIPVQRSLSIDYTFDPNIYQPAYENEYLFGASLLVIPATSKQYLVKAYLPKGLWYSFYDDQAIKGGKEILTESPLGKLPVFVKAGAIIPVQKQVQYTGENPGDTLEIHIYKGNGTHRFVYYEDDGTSYRYESGDFYQRTITYEGQKSLLKFGTPSGKIESKFHVIRIIFHGFSANTFKNFRSNHLKMKAKFSKQPLYLKKYQTGKVFTVNLPLNKKEFEVQWN